MQHTKFTYVANNELARLARRSTTGDQRTSLLTEALERGDSVKRFGRLSETEQDITREFALTHVSLGHPTHASRLLEDACVRVNWKENTIQEEFVYTGYAHIARSILNMLSGGDAPAREDLARLRDMRELTGVHIPDKIHNVIASGLPAVRRPRVLVSTVELYLIAVDRPIDRETAGRLYAAAYVKSGPSLTDYFDRLYKATGQTPQNDVMEKLENRVLRNGLGGYNRDYNLIAKRFGFYLSFEETAEGREARVDRLLARDMPSYIKSIVKLEAGRQLLQKDIDNLFDNVLIYGQRHDTIDSVTDYEQVRLDVANLNYMLEHGLKPSKGFFERVISLKWHDERISSRINESLDEMQERLR